MAQPPKARRIETPISQTGRTRIDPYAWLKDPDWQSMMQTPEKLGHEIRTHLEAENAYCRDMLAGTEALQSALVAEMRARIKEDDSTVPTPDGLFEYYIRYREGGQYPIFARRPLDPETFEPGLEQILLDGDAQAKGRAYFQISAAAHSPDHALFAYAVDLKGNEFFEIRVRDLATGNEFADVITSAYGDFAWANDSRTLFWTWRDENGRPARVYRHRLGQSEKTDALVYQEPDDGFFLGVGLTESRRFVVISAGDHVTNEVRLVPADEPDQPARLVAPREPGVEYAVTDHDGRLVILTNADGAVDFKIVTAPYDATGRSAWRDLTPHRPGHFIRGLAAFEDFLVWSETANALPRMMVRARSDGTTREVAMADSAYDLTIEDNILDWTRPIVRYVYSTPAQPPQTFDHHLIADRRTLRKVREIPSGHDPSSYVVTRFSATAPDGAEIPVTVLHRKDIALDGSAPVMLYGYGAYGITTSAGFSANRLSLVDRGSVFAIAHVRGGSDKGYGWYLDGKLAKKVNSFLDFVAAGQELAKRGYCRLGRIVSYGGSAGGLLVGAALNMAPNLFGGVIAAVPFVDVLNTMSDKTLPLTPPEWPEWGNPLSDPSAYDQILNYSPYDNIRRRRYPPVLATAGLSDPRVTYWEPAKWIARLRAEARGGPFLLYVNMDAGHAGASGRFDRLGEVAREYAFAMRAVGDPATSGFKT
jgi:oligopeptidase B